MASQFKNSSWLDNEIIFASGVSNSRETKPSEFNREIELIESFFETKSVFIYFSTCSIFDPSLSNSSYIQHKLYIEKIIEEKFDNYLILRLPCLIGLTNNPHTFFNYFFHSISESLPVNIEKNSSRYFLDVEDIEPIVKCLVKKRHFNRTINVAFDNRISVIDAIRIMEKYMKKTAVSHVIEKGAYYTIPNKEVIELQDLLPRFDTTREYNDNCFKKYINLK